MATPIQYQDPTMQLLTSLLGNKTSTTTSSNIDPAAQKALQDLLTQMQGSSTPEGMSQYLGQLFKAGAEKIPELSQAFANASGARTTDNSSLQLALSDLNTQLATQSGTLALQQQANLANTATGLANATKTQTQTQKTGLGGNPLLMAGAGTLLNQLNKRGLIDKGLDAVGGLFSNTGGVDTSAAEVPNAFSIGNALTAGGDSGGGYSFDMPDFSGIADSFSGAVSDFDAGSLFAPGGSFDQFFADGGMPARGRTNMGEQAPVTLQGALQLSDAQMLQQLVDSRQQQAQMPVDTTGEPQEKKGQDQRTPGLNSGYSPDALGMAQTATKANSYANLAGLGIPGMGPVSGLINAQTPQQAVNATISGMVGFANPLLGILTKWALDQMPSGPVQQGVPGSLENPENEAVTTLPGRSDGGKGGFDGVGDRGPGGSSGESGAAAGGAGPGGPGDGSFANGGMPARGAVAGPGTGTSDSIAVPLAHLSNGEYVISADVVNAMGGPQFFDQLQAAFHQGGKPA